MDRAEYIRDRLQFEILNGSIDSGSLLDEYSMVKRFGGPRSAIRAALLQMAAAGIVSRERRVGTSPQTPTAHFTSSPSTTFRADGVRTPQMVTLRMERLRAPADIAAELRVHPDDEVTYLERSAIANGVRTTFWRIWTPLDIGSAFPSGIPEDKTWYELAAIVSGEHEFRVARDIMGLRATEEDAVELDVAVGSPITFSARLTTTASGVPIDRSFSRVDPTRIVNSDTFTVIVDDAAAS